MSADVRINLTVTVDGLIYLAADVVAKKRGL